MSGFFLSRGRTSKHECGPPVANWFNRQWLGPFSEDAVWQCDCGQTWVLVTGPSGSLAWMGPYPSSATSGLVGVKEAK